MKLFSAFLFSVLMTPVQAFVEAWTMSKLWTWFDSAQFGRGPSFGAWYGISLILGLIVGGQLLNVTRKQVESDKLASHLVTTSLGVVVGCLLILGTAWVVGSLTGWMA